MAQIMTEKKDVVVVGMGSQYMQSGCCVKVNHPIANQAVRGHGAVWWGNFPSNERSERVCRVNATKVKRTDVSSSTVDDGDGKRADINTRGTRVGLSFFAQLRELANQRK